MKKCDMLYEGKAKKVYATEDPELYIVDYKDDATAFNGLKKGTIAGKGAINNRVTNYLMQMLYLYGGSINMEQSNWDSIDKTIDIGSGSYESYGFGKGSTVRVYGNVRDGVAFDFSIKQSQYDHNLDVTSPVDGVKITTSQYSGSDSGYNIHIDPISLQKALELFSQSLTYLSNAG